MTKSQQIKYQAFAEEYVSNGFNATKAYKYINPNVKQSTAMCNGAKLLRNAQVFEAIQEEKSKRLQLKRFSKESQLERIDNVAELSLKKDKLQITLNSLDLINKMQGYYEKEGESGQIERVLQAFQVNVEVKNEVNVGEKGKTFTHEVKSEVIDNK